MLYFAVEATLLMLISATMLRRAQRLRSTAAALVGLFLIVPAAGHTIQSTGLWISPAGWSVAVGIQVVLACGILLEELAEARTQAARRRTDRTVEEHRRMSDAARSRAYRALRAVEEHHGWH